MALRPPRAGLSVARRLSERARAASPEVDVTGGIAGMVDALRGLVRQLADTEHDLGGGDGKTSVVFGYTLKVGPDGISGERFGDVPQKAATPARQPIVDIFEEATGVVVVAELPGADPASIVCRVEPQRLLIEAAGVRRYRKQVALPVAVRAEGMQQSFCNGILEVRLVREDAA
jgi:HSP20 family molecular chaperone IbpA